MIQPFRSARWRTSRPSGWLLPLALLLALGGCASLGWDGVIDPALPTPEARPDAVPFRIAGVQDLRKFQRVSYALRTPSVHKPDQVSEEGRSRVVGRRLGTQGGNLWLPEDRSVRDLAVEATSRALVGAGLRKVASDSPEAAEAIPVSIEVLSLWAWLRFAEYAPDVTHAEVALRIEAPIPPLRGGAIACGKSQKVAPALSSGLWASVIEAALSDLESDLAQSLASPGRPAPAWRCRPGIGRATAQADE